MVSKVALRFIKMCRLVFCWIGPKYNKLQIGSSLTGQTLNYIEPGFVYQNQTMSLFEPFQKARTSKLFGQIWAEPMPKSVKTELRTFPNPGLST